MRSVLNTLPTWAIGMIFVGGLVLLGASGLALVRRRMPTAASGAYNELASFILPLVVGVYGIVLGFVIVALYDAYGVTADDVQTEAATLEDVYRYSRALPPAAAEDIEAHIGMYVREVVDNEWDLLADAKSSPDAASALKMLFDDLANLEPQDDNDTVFLSQALADLQDVHIARHRRLDAAAETLPATLRLFVYLGGLGVLALTYFFGMPDGRAQMLMVVALSAVLGFGLMLVAVLDHPFSGDGGISSSHLQAGELQDFFTADAEARP